MRFRTVAVSLCVLLLDGSALRAQRVGDTPHAADRAAVDAAWARLLSALAHDSAAAVLASYTEGAAAVEVGRPPLIGRPAIDSVLGGQMAHYRYANLRREVTDFESDGHLASEIGTLRAVITPKDKEGAAGNEAAVRYVVLYERQADGRWLLRQWFESPPVAPRVTK